MLQFELKYHIEVSLDNKRKKCRRGEIQRKINNRGGVLRGWKCTRMSLWDKKRYTSQNLLLDMQCYLS